MKRHYLHILTLSFTVFAACKKAPGPANGHSISLNNSLDSMVSISAMIDSQKLQTDSVFAYFVKTSGNDSAATGLMINSYVKNSSPAQSLNLFITNYTGPNTYLINPPYNTATYYSGTARYYATSGQIVIASDTAYALIGTFNFVAGTDTVTNGVFNAAIP